MTVTILETSEAVARALAERVASLLRGKPEAVIGLAAGRTPVDGYAEMQRLHAEGQMDWSRASTFNLDEFAGRYPIEMLGRTRFPRIGELPYLLTLGGYGFYWIRLPGLDSDATGSPQ